MRQEYSKACELFLQVQTTYPNTLYAEKAHLGIIEAQIATKQFEAAKAQFSSFLRLYPNSEQKAQVFEIHAKLIKMENQKSWWRALGWSSIGKFFTGACVVYVTLVGAASALS